LGLGLITGSLLLVCGNNGALAQNKSTGKETGFDQKVNAINQAAKKKGQMDTVLGDICNNTGLNLHEVQALHTSHPNAGVGAILVAAVIADQTQQPAEKFLESRINGTTWESIAAHNKVPMDKLNQKLDKVLSALNNPQTPAAGSASGRTQSSVQPPANTSASVATTGKSNSGGNIDQKVSALNDNVQSNGSMAAALHAISVETGVPEDQVKTLQQSHSDAGAGGVLVASVLADETKQAPETFLQSHAGGKSWDTIAGDNRVAPDKINRRFNKVQSFIGAGSGSLAPTGR
jgi:hypothetical protein